MTIKVTVVDYDCGNLFSVCRAFEHCGAEVELTEHPGQIRAADRVVLPGVGAFGDAARALRGRGLDVAVSEFVATGRPMLGICVGMQLLFERGEEFGEHDGWGFVPGCVKEIPKTSIDGRRLKIPHIGWNELLLPTSANDWSGTILHGIERPIYCYFVHSFGGISQIEDHRLADCIYGGNRILAAVRNENVWGCQFHPEKSATQGLRIIENFLRF